MTQEEKLTKAIIEQENRGADLISLNECLDKLNDVTDLIFLGYSDTNNNSYLIALDSVIEAKQELKAIKSELTE